MGPTENSAKHDALAAAVSAAGFFTNGVEERDGCWDRTTVCSEGKNGVLGGNSFWVTRLSAGWYLGTWGGMIYRIPEQSRIAEFCVTWLKRESRLKSDFSSDVKAEFALVPVSDAEFNRETGTIAPQVEATAIAEVHRRTAIEPDQLVAQAEWDGDKWEVRVWRLPATDVFDYSLVISTIGEAKEFNRNTMS